MNRRYTVIAGHIEQTDQIALIHVDGKDLADVYENAILLLQKNVEPGDWEVLYTFPGVLEPEEYFTEEAEDVQELNDRHRDTGRSTREPSDSGVSGTGEVQPSGQRDVGENQE